MRFIYSIIAVVVKIVFQSMPQKALSNFWNKRISLSLITEIIRDYNAFINAVRLRVFNTQQLSQLPV
jgi:hypothetical protein